ncbi:hypothetical protein [Flavobacterium sp. UMI-01]|uniref:hypothetical protein n=1 Tax=Flavobacterium sp. UMI-01 TaxID=1441053 RepID=UPI001C7E104C|nr:hypothetical protein [Flavobacterium sp. UMI-01]GIZ09393.1 hypothetical protein FUMI01_21200 [Flavobacterium sp. UMI-01]
MKKITLVLASVALLSIFSCKDKNEEPAEESTHVIEKTNTVIVEKDTDTVVKTENPDGTSVSVDKNGLEFSSKDGNNKTEVNINK